MSEEENPGAVRDVPVDWEALEDAFENNAPEVHSYLHLGTGEVLRVVDGIADPQMHSRIAADPAYVRVRAVRSAARMSPGRCSNHDGACWRRSVTMRLRAGVRHKRLRPSRIGR